MLTLFSVPKPFEGHIGVIQRNAIESWMRLEPRPQIILLGDEAGTAEVAAEMELQHIPGISLSELGTPLLDDVFRKAWELSQYETMAFINGDIILMQDFSEAVARIEEAAHGQYLAIGRRIDIRVDDPIEFTDENWATKLVQHAAKSGVPASRMCKDFFVFRKPLYQEIPPFIAGRGIFDSWLVHHAHRQKVPVIDVTPVVRAIHQNHGYGHVSGGRGAAYLFGSEVKRNQELAGGRLLIAGSYSTWTLTKAKLKRTSPMTHFSRILADLPRGVMLLLDLLGLFSRRS